MDHPSQAPPRAQITFNDLLQIHSYLSNLKEPSPTIRASIDQLEYHINTFITSLSTNPTGTMQ